MPRAGAAPLALARRWQPERAAAERPAPAWFASRALGRLAVCLLVGGCASASPQPHRELTAVWRDYRALPSERALAISGDLDRGRWVAGVSGGHASRSAAEAAALEECARRRAQRRMQTPCLLYAVGDEVVWPER